MIILKPKRFNLFLGGDVLTLIVLLVLFIVYFQDRQYTNAEWTIMSTFLFLSLVIRYGKKTVKDNIDNGFSLQVIDFIKAQVIVIVLVFLLFLFFPIPAKNRNLVMALVIAFPTLSITINYFLVNLTGTLVSKNRNVKYTLVAGTGKLAKTIESDMEARKRAQHRIKGFVNCMKNEECLVEGNKVIGGIKEMHQYLESNPVDEIIIALPVRPPKNIKNIISAADYHGIRVKYVPDYQNVFGSTYKISKQGNIHVINVRRLPLDKWPNKLLKNSFDKVFSAIALTLLSPLFLFIAALIKLDSKGPVFYCPVRIGRSGRAFKVFKFRSMRENDSVAGGVLSTQKDDPRVTKIGKILRKYSIDELPQFINVFMGEMSVIGPRPHRSFLNKELQQSVDKYMIRHYFKPGITGWAQVNGWRGPTDTDEQKRQRTLHDLWYIENWSLWLDFKIVFLTVFSKKVHSNAF